MGATTFYLLEKEREERAKRQTKQRDKERQEIETEQEEIKDLTGYTVAELKELAKEQGIEGYSNMKKNELITALE